MNEQEQHEANRAWVRLYRERHGGTGRVFNERMQETERQRRLAGLGIKLAAPQVEDASRDAAAEQARLHVERVRADLAQAKQQARSHVSVSVWALEALVDPPVSDTVSSDTGGRPVSRPGAENGPQSLSRPASPVDRERVRREAERALAPRGPWVGDDVVALSRDVLALLAELEQAERERDHAAAELARCGGKLYDAEARLARVPALVVALREASDYLAHDEADAAEVVLTTALAEWEQA